MNNTLIKNLKSSVKTVFGWLGFKISKIPNKNTSPIKWVQTRVGKFSIFLTSNHLLPFYLENHPFYSTNLPRLALLVIKKYKDLRMIDVGANVGDTVALVRSACHFPIVSIEGDDKFFEILKVNLKQFEGVECYKQLLGEKDGTIEAILLKNIETARIQSTNTLNQKATLNIMKLDSFLENHRSFSSAKLLKIDTDGYDMKVIRGGMRFVKDSKPVLFFEYFFHEDQEDDGISTLLLLENAGYKDIIFYDNFGKFILSANLSDRILIKQLHNYIDKRTRTPLSYYDIILFHEEDSDLARKFIEDEMHFFYQEKDVSTQYEKNRHTPDLR